jgi:hypothetical protein
MPTDSRSHAWLDEKWGADGWAWTPSGMRGVPNDAVSIYFLDAALSDAFVSRRCAVPRPEPFGGIYEVRTDELAQRAATPPRTQWGCSGPVIACFDNDPA